MELKKETRTIIEVNCLSYGLSEEAGLDRFIQHCYNLPDRFQITECPNDTYKRFKVDREPLDDYDTEEAEENLEQGYCTLWELGTILNKMCLDGFIEPGIYLVNMSW